MQSNSTMMSRVRFFALILLLHRAFVELFNRKVGIAVLVIFILFLLAPIIGKFLGLEDPVIDPKEEADDRIW